MFSNSTFRPAPYVKRQVDILSNETPYNGRVNLEEPENPDARFQMFEKINVENKATVYNDAIKGIWEESTLSKVFFSAENIQIVQNGLKAGVYEKSGDKQLIIPNQNIDILKQYMRQIFIDYVTYQPTNITQQVERLNKIVLDQLIPKVYSEAIGYIKYLEDVSRLAVPIELPRQSDRVYKQLELKPYM